ncbi:craniofacial development protein 2-like [Schistocerca cancellata]|uniref:craniofacial development protein 2-like n=1 Tax=Schistocerca cancellata TaxID=274614 RepID=UPI0021199B32|nr:craniofacial development protein 2-like [Schistocerca cancellata]
MNKIKWQEQIKVTTWNVKSVSQGGKIHNTIQEMDRMGIEILGVSEFAMIERRRYINGHRVPYSADGKHEHGVGVILSAKPARWLSSFTPVSACIMLLQLSSSPSDVNIIQVHEPTMDKKDEKIEEFYGNINGILRKRNKYEFTTVMEILIQK